MYNVQHQQLCVQIYTLQLGFQSRQITNVLLAFLQSDFLFLLRKKQVWRLSEADLIIKVNNIFGWIVKHIVCIGKWFGQIGTESYLDVTRWLHKHFQCHNKYRKIRFHFIIVSLESPSYCSTNSWQPLKTIAC